MKFPPADFGQRLKYFPTAGDAEAFHDAEKGKSVRRTEGGVFNMCAPVVLEMCFVLPSPSG